jgi:hypothetical protein
MGGSKCRTNASDAMVPLTVNCFMALNIVKADF